MADSHNANTVETGASDGSEIFYKAHTELLEMVVEARPIQEIFDKTARLIESISPVRTWCTLKLVEKPGLKPMLAAAPSLPESLTEELVRIHVRPDDGTCGQAVTLRKTVISTDIATDPTNKIYHEIAIRSGIKSCWSVPVLNHSGAPVAVITSFYHQTYQPDQTILRRVEAMCDLIRLAIERQQASQELTRSNQKFRSAAAATNDAIWDWDILNDNIWWNDGFSKLFGFEGKGPGPTILGWQERIHPEERNRVHQSIVNATQGTLKHWREHYRFRKNDGTFADVLDQAEIIFDSEWNAVRMIGGMSDITYQRKAEHELEALNRALEMLRSCNRKLIRATDENQLLIDICTIATDIGGYKMAWVGYADSGSEKSIVPVANIGDSSGYLSSIRLTYSEDDHTGKGPAGQTIRTGKLVISQDILNVDDTFSWKSEALSRGFRSIVCLPLLNSGEECFGILALYSNEVSPVSEDEQVLLQELADNLAFGISSIRSRSAQKTTQDTIVKVAKAVSDSFGTQFYQLLAKNMVEALRADAGIIGRIEKTTNSVSTLAYVLNGVLQENVNYGLNGTPCERIISKQVCVFEKDLPSLFPEDHYLIEIGIQAYAGIALYDTDGEPVGILSVLFKKPIRDIPLVISILRIFAERAASEMARLEADTRIFDQASLLDKARDAIFTYSLDHRITYWNKSAERLYGFTSQEALSNSTTELLYKNNAEYMAAFALTLANGEWLGELCQIDHGGNELIVESRWNLVRDSTGEPRSILTINTDITARKSLEEQLIRSQRMESIGTLAGGLAHDLNNVLAPISMSIELLRRSVDDSRGRELLNTIALSSQRAAEMVTQILSFARGASGRRIPVPTSGVIAELAGMIRDTFPKNISFKTNIPDGLLPVIGDATQLHQVLLNLCLNARDAMPDGGTLSISAANEDSTKSDPFVRIEVRDTGHGIPPEITEKIYDPFFTTKDFGKGTGLGLATTLAIVKGHRGHITSVSEPGKFTRFTLLLPALSLENFPDLQKESIHPLPNGEGETVLVIDDEPAILDMMKKILENFGYLPLTANSGLSGLAIYRANSERISVVVTDMMMPGIGGSGTIEEIFRIDPSAKVIAISGVAANEEIAKSSGAGVSNFLKKPFTAKEILLALEDILNR